jgi:CheY-like chemotaxis protein
VPVILLSGHPLEEQPKDADALAVSAWLFKPPEPRQLAEAIAQALQAAPRPRHRANMPSSRS